MRSGTVVAPTTDAGVPAFVDALELPGLIDVHVHFMPDRVLRKVRAWFDGYRFADGTGWPVRYRTDDAARIQHLRSMGVRRFTALSYPHRPGMAAWLNDWAHDFAGRVPECVPSATLYPEPGVEQYVDVALARGAQVFKSHIAVGGYDPRDERLRSVWSRLSALRVPVVIHTGSGPEAGPWTGPAVFSDLMDTHPELTAVVAHMGAPEHEQYLALLPRYPNLHLDTTMAFTDFFNRITTFGDGYVQQLADVGDRILFGTDFPNIPHPYAHQIEALVRLGFDRGWLRAVCHDNAARLLAAVQPDAQT